MPNPEIQGFTALQRELADQLWQLDSHEQVQEYMTSLPRNLRREAAVVAHMIIAAELDRVNDVHPDLTTYLRSL